MALEKQIVTVQAVEDAFGVIEPVHGKYDLLPLELLAQLRHAAFRFRRRGALGEAREINAHGKSIHFDHAVAQGQIAQMVLITRRAQDRREEIARIIVRMKSNQAGPKQSFNDLRPPGPRQQAKYLVRWKRDMQKETNGHLRESLPHQARQEQKVIVVNPQDVLRLQHLRQGVGESAIDPLVFLPMLLLKPGQMS